MAVVSRTVKVFLAVVAVTLLALAGLAALLVRFIPWDFLTMWTAVLVGLGAAYVFYAFFAWTGFANLYRVSPTLFFGLPSYRRVVVRSQMLKEGRDPDAFAYGLALGGTLVAIGAALYSLIFVAVDLAALALVIGVLLVVRRTGARARS